MLAAQAIVVSLLAACIALTITITSTDDSDYLKTADHYRAIMLVIEQLPGDDSDVEVLGAIDRAFISPPVADSPMVEGFIARRHGRVIYRSASIPPGIYNGQLDVVQAIRTDDGATFHTLKRKSSRSDTEVTYVVRYHRMFWLIMLVELGLVPLLYFLPLLLFAAWLSVHLAFRPWRHVSREIAGRNFADLNPLPVKPRHRELRPMLEAINALLARMAATFERERSFIADAAHELRTPLAALRVTIETLERHKDAPLREDVMENLLLGMHRISRMVDQLLKLMRSEARIGGHAMQPLDLHELVQERLAMLDPLASAGRIDLVLEADEEPLQIEGERESLISMLDNLIENAIKYSPRGGTITVGLAREAGRIVLRIADQGPGIPLTYRQRVFDRFYRVPDQTQTGSGLGLAIARSAVERHGGDILLEDGVPHGLVVTLRFTRMHRAPAKMGG